MHGSREASSSGIATPPNQPVQISQTRQKSRIACPCGDSKQYQTGTRINLKFSENNYEDAYARFARITADRLKAPTIIAPRLHNMYQDIIGTKPSGSAGPSTTHVAVIEIPDSDAFFGRWVSSVTMRMACTTVRPDSVPARTAILQYGSLELQRVASMRKRSTHRGPVAVTVTSATREDRKDTRYTSWILDHKSIYEMYERYKSYCCRDLRLELAKSTSNCRLGPSQVESCGDFEVTCKSAESRLEST
ncbi:hypothetical protein C8R45DRAFT_923309 [Mycena sanguinolenta]|nr:hypothetical protein C8R45DRAFT_923309 [Mycena sanguinolenta]